MIEKHSNTNINHHNNNSTNNKNGNNNNSRNGNSSVVDYEKLSENQEHSRENQYLCKQVGAITLSQLITTNSKKRNTEI